MKKKNRYHTNYIIRYQLGLLPEDERRLIPCSTRSYW